MNGIIRERSAPTLRPLTNLIVGGLRVADTDSIIAQVCRRCKHEKPLSDFNKDKSKKLGVRGICKPCHRIEAKEYAEPRRQLYVERAQKWYFENKERKQDYDKKRRPKYYAENRAAMLARTNRRRSAIRTHTPKWADKQAINAIYLKAAQMTIETGVQYEVDHIVPVVSALVCGLHCEQNLQILTSYENKKKTNLWWPDMPEVMKV